MFKRLIILFGVLSLMFGSAMTLAGGHKNKGAKPDAAISEPGAKGKAEKKGREEKDDDIVEDSDDDIDDIDEDANDNSAGRGNERSQEMRERRDQRKDIQSDYRENREPGQERADGDDDKAAKKPWYKFWE